MASANTAYLTMLLVNLNNFQNYFNPILFSFCMIGNFLDILLFSRQRFRTVSCSTYFLAAAVVAVVQYGVGFSFLAYGYDHANPITSIVAICKIYNYLQQSTSMMQRWLMTAATFDRYACTSSRPSLRNFAKIRVARRLVLAIVVIWVMIAVYRAVFYNIKANICSLFGNEVVALIHGIYIVVGGAVIPLSIMIPSLILIQRNLAHKRQRRQGIVVQQKEGNNDAQKFERKRDQQVLAILLVQVIAYIILITPLMVYQVYSAITLPIQNKPIDRVLIEQFAFGIANLLAIVYTSVPFYLNTMTSRMFREELMIVVRNIVYCRCFTHTNRVEPFVTHPTSKEPTTARYGSKNMPTSRLVVTNVNVLETAITANPKQANINQNMTQ